MKKRGSNRFLIGLFLISLGIFLIVTNLNKPRVLILHSYYTDYSWVRDINEGLDRVFKKYSYNIRYHYMDTKRHTDNNFKIKAGLTVIKMIESWKPDVILSIDDNAQQMAFKQPKAPKKIKSGRFNQEILKQISNNEDRESILRYYIIDNNKKLYILKEDLTKKEIDSISDILKSVKFKKIKDLPVTKHFLNNPQFKIVFTGVNASARKYGYDKGTNVTGVLERIPFQSFKDIFLKVLPEGRRRIVHISDSSPTSKAIL
ncbi:MAG TPA: hypothetical protein ENI73_05420, partial [Spirochaetes bacterium]|nr:hypothetical protein [Spirochaetota bacterium]